MADTGKMTGRKAFACIMNTMGEEQQIFTICHSNRACAGYNDIQALAQKFMAGSGNADTHWSLETAQQNAQVRAIAG